ncbi:hypothetical protein, partial [Thermococcus sp.]
MSILWDVILAGLILFLLVLVYIYAKMILGFIKGLRGESVDWETRYFWALAVFGVIITPIVEMLGHYGKGLSIVIFALSSGLFSYLYLYRYEAKVKKTVLWDERTLMIKEKAAYAFIKAELLMLLGAFLYLLYRYLHRSVMLWERAVLVGVPLLPLVLLLYLLATELKLDEREKRIREKVSREIFKIEYLGVLFVSTYFFAVARLKHIEEYNIYGIGAF